MSDFSGTELLIGLVGGLALFLFGIEQLAGSLRVVAGERMRMLLGRLTSNRFTGVATGAFVTAVLQSSSVTTVLVVGFVTAGLMSLSQSVGIIMGANIGTTITAQIIAFKVSHYALLVVAAGFALIFFGRSSRARHQGTAVMGLGLVFFGMSVMGEAMSPLRTYEPFLDAMARMQSPRNGILAGALFTALVQSSSATTGVVIVMAGQGLISLEAGIALILGANIGTCVTALLATIGKTREALRAALVHVLFNVLGVLIWLPLIGWLGEVVTAMSPQAGTLAGSARMAAETPRQIANSHTIFNVANTLLFIGFAGQFARVVEWLVPDLPIVQEDAVRAKYLNRELVSTPILALDRARLEILRMGDRVRDMLEEILPAMLTGSAEQLQSIASMDDAVDALHGQIVTYLGEISQTELDERHTTEMMKLFEATNDLENIGDIIETNLVVLGQRREQGGFEVSPATRGVIEEFHSVVVRAVEDALVAVTQKNAMAAKRVTGAKRQVNRLAQSAAIHQAQRLVAREPHRLPAYTVEMDILENLKRIYYFAKRMARAAVPPGQRARPSIKD